MHPIEIVVDQLLETDGRALFNVWFFNRSGEALGEYLQLDSVCPGLGDAGAIVAGLIHLLGRVEAGELAGEGAAQGARLGALGEHDARHL